MENLDTKGKPIDVIYQGIELAEFNTVDDMYTVKSQSSIESQPMLIKPTKLIKTEKPFSFEMVLVSVDKIFSPLKIYMVNFDPE